MRALGVGLQLDGVEDAAPMRRVGGRPTHASRFAAALRPAAIASVIWFTKPPPQLEFMRPSFKASLGNVKKFHCRALRAFRQPLS